ncbi:hypothetical protein EDC55_10624 [Allofrancisella inopinata]|uniref:Glycosyl transferase-like sugar-binding protein n=1 Tax=Allofrancisella inopinata TaxID=1085647 RepID=A0AAE6YJD6_9GAMM|nr:hypothetical protein [Allofrancisella inopinata]QIV95794.1 hypothetical protein E4K63_02675 [Allofrancisella inopinata]TDT72810.1 hypothetical protein EDC55_10624 [Allofrancisella inopinata]
MESNFIHFYWAGPEGKDVPHFVYRNLNIWAKHLYTSKSLFIPILWCNEAVYKILSQNKIANITSCLTNISLPTTRDSGLSIGNDINHYKSGRQTSYKNFYSLLPKETEAFYGLNYKYSYESHKGFKEKFGDKEKWVLKKEVEDRFKCIPVIVVNFESYLYNLGETDIETENFRFLLEVYKLYNKPYFYAFVKDTYNVHFLANFGGLYFDIDFLPLKEDFFKSMNQIRTEKYNNSSLNLITSELRYKKFQNQQNFTFVLVKYCDISDESKEINISRISALSKLNYSEIGSIASYDVGFQICLEPVKRKNFYIPYTLLSIREEFKSDYANYEKNVKEYKEKTRKVFPSGLFQDNKYSGYEGVNELQKKINEQNLRKYSSYFKNNAYPEQYYKDLSDLGDIPAHNLVHHIQPLVDVTTIVIRDLYDIITFKVSYDYLRRNQGFITIDQNYKMLYLHLFWNKFTRIYKYTPSTLIYTGYEKMNNFFKIADCVKDHFSRKRQKLFQQFSSPNINEIANTNFKILKIPNANIILHRDKWLKPKVYQTYDGVYSGSTQIKNYFLRISNVNGRKIEIIINDIAKYDIKFYDNLGNLLHQIEKVEHFKMLSHNSNSRFAIEYKKHNDNEYRFVDIHQLSTATKWLRVNKAYTYQEFKQKFDHLINRSISLT